MSRAGRSRSAEPEHRHGPPANSRPARRAGAGPQASIRARTRSALPAHHGAQVRAVMVRRSDCGWAHPYPARHARRSQRRPARRSSANFPLSYAVGRIPVAEESRVGYTATSSSTGTPAWTLRTAATPAPRCSWPKRPRPRPCRPAASWPTASGCRTTTSRKSAPPPSSTAPHGPPRRGLGFRRLHDHRPSPIKGTDSTENRELLYPHAVPHPAFPV